MNEKEWNAELEIVSLEDCKLRDVNGGTDLLHISADDIIYSVIAGDGRDILRLNDQNDSLSLRDHSIQTYSVTGRWK